MSTAKQSVQRIGVFLAVLFLILGAVMIYTGVRPNGDIFYATTGVALCALGLTYFCVVDVSTRN